MICKQRWTNIREKWVWKVWKLSLVNKEVTAKKYKFSEQLRFLTDIDKDRNVISNFVINERVQSTSNDFINVFNDTLGINLNPNNVGTLKSKVSELKQLRQRVTRRRCNSQQQISSLIRSRYCNTCNVTSCIFGCKWTRWVQMFFIQINIYKYFWIVEWCLVRNVIPNEKSQRETRLLLFLIKN